MTKNRRNKMTAFEKIEYSNPPQHNKVYKYTCPECSNGLECGAIPCPDGLVGCLVLHRGWRCVGCGSVWKIST